MNFIVKLFRSIWYLLWYLFAAVVVLTAAVFGLARLLLPLIGDYNRDVEQYATKLADRPIKIMSMDAEWHGFSPSLVLNNVRVLSRDGTDTILNVSRARLDFDLLFILTSQNIQFRRFALSGVDMSLVRLNSGQVILSGFEAGQLNTGGDEDTTAILQWLLAQGEINIHARNLVYQDNKANQKRYHFSNVSFDLRNMEARHLIDGAIGFPETDNQEFAFALDIRGDITTGGNWSGRMYASGTNLNIARIFGDLGSQGHRVTIGNSNFEIWTKWQNAKLVSLQGDLSLEKIKWQSGKKFTPLLKSLLQDKNNPDETADKDTFSQPGVVEYHNIIGRFLWDSDHNGWQLQADNFVMARDSRIWPSTQFSLGYLQNQAESRQFVFRSNLIRIEDLTPLVPILFGKFKNYSSLVKQLSPRGDIKHINFRWNEADDDFDLAARLDKVGFESMGKIPGFSSLSGELQTSKKQGSLLLKTGESDFSLPDMFRWDIPIKHLRGRFDWQNSSHQLLVSSRDLELSTAHVQSRALIDLEIPKDKGAPFLTLITNFEKGDASKGSYYYPLSYLKKSIKWLDAAIIQGDILSGGAIVYGPLDQFPFTKGQGVFEARFKVKNGILDYVDEWPEIHDLSADVLFRGNSLSVTSNHAKIFNSTLSDVQVNIENLRKRPLAIDIQTKITGKTQEKLNYLILSPPLNRRYGKYLENIKASGDSELDLNIALQVKPKVESRVSGKLRMSNNRLEFSSIPNLLTDINGELDVTQNGLSAKSINAVILGQPGLLSVGSKASEKDSQQNQLVITGRGKFNAKKLSASYFPVLQDMVDGESKWNARVTLPTGSSSSADRNVLIKVYSSLKGVELNLPPPFNKRKTDEYQFRLAMNISNREKALIKAVYGSEFEGVFESVFDSPFWVTRGEARFGGGPVVMPHSDGLRIVGTMKELSVDIWRNLFNQIKLQAETDSGSKQKSQDNSDNLPAHLALVNSVDLFINRFTFLGQPATNLKLSVRKKDDWLKIKVDSKEMAGEITVPKDLEKQHMIFNMKHLYIKSKEGSGGKVDPRGFPAIKFNSRFVAFDNKQLGQVAFETSKTENGLLLQQLIINPRQTTIKGFGHWFIDQGVQDSSLEFELNSDDLGTTMRDLGYVETIEDGSGSISARLQWPSMIFDPTFSQLNGTVELDFKKGRILDIEPGRAARLFGLLSIQTLPRRLTLDFSDMFSKGLSFDSVTGSFRLEEGDAYTKNFMLKGPNADIALQGRIGLGAQDYDQKIRVTPHITDAAVLLSIITAQPLLIVLQQLLKSDIEGAASVEYALTGSWDNYSLEPVLKQPLTEDDADQF